MNKRSNRKCWKYPTEVVEEERRQKGLHGQCFGGDSDRLPSRRQTVSPANQIENGPQQGYCPFSTTRSY